MGVTLMASGRVATAPAPSATCAVKAKLPAVEGVPLMTPAALKANPAGSVPDCSDQLSAPSPPMRARVWL